MRTVDLNNLSPEESKLLKNFINLMSASKITSMVVCFNFRNEIMTIEIHDPENTLSGEVEQMIEIRGMINEYLIKKSQEKLN